MQARLTLRYPMQTRLIDIVPLQAAHASDLVEAMQDRDFWRCDFLPQLPAPNLQAVQQHIDQCLHDWAERGILTLVGLHAGRVAGVGRLLAYAPQHGRVQLGGLWLRPSAQRLGIGRHASWLLHRELFEAQGLRRVEYLLIPENKLSRLSIAHLGATREGLLRDYVVLNGASRDMWMYGLTRDD